LKALWWAASARQGNWTVSPVIRKQHCEEIALVTEEPDHDQVLAVGAPAPEPLPHRSEADIVATWEGDTPVVSIICPTYQHVGFIEDAIRGFLGQETIFPFEVIIRDDASSDGTDEIVADYRDRYPLIIRAILETENTYPAVKPGEVMFPLAKGEFIAWCEGDDYWIDSAKLQTQVRTLRCNRRAVLSHHQSIEIAGGG